MRRRRRLEVQDGDIDRATPDPCDPPARALTPPPGAGRPTVFASSPAAAAAAAVDGGAFVTSPSATHANGLRKLPRGIHTNSPPLNDEGAAAAAAIGQSTGQPDASRRPSMGLDPVVLQRQVASLEGEVASLEAEQTSALSKVSGVNRSDGSRPHPQYCTLEYRTQTYNKIFILVWSRYELYDCTLSCEHCTPVPPHCTPR